jgi:glycogen synthase
LDFGCRNKVISVPYSLDDTVWDPAKDKFLPATYSAEDLSGKAICKVALRRRVGLSETQASAAIVSYGCCFFLCILMEFILS